MEKKLNSKLLDKLLQSYYFETKSPQVNLLDEWIKKYPQYEDELRDFTVTWTMVEFFSEGQSPEVDWEREMPIDKPRIRNLLKRIRQEQALKSAGEGPIRSIIMECNQKDITFEELATTLDISIPVLAKLDNRLIDYFSIPLQFIKGLAEAIQREILLTAKYLNGAPQLLERASFKSNRKPIIPQKENFFDVIRNDEGINDRQRMRWLSLEPPREG